MSHSWRLPKDSSNYPAQAIKPGRTLGLTFGATATTATGPIMSSLVQLYTTVDAHFLFVNSATETLAATSDTPMPANVPILWGVDPNKILSIRIAATATETAGSAWVTEAG